MKAIVRYRYGSADVLAVKHVEIPEIAADEVLLRVRAAGVDRGVWHVMTGKPYLVRLVFGIRRPKVATLGMDVAGVIEAVGAEVTGVQPGEEVFGICNGSFAHYASASPDKLARKPANLTFQEAAAVPVSGLTALQAVRDKGRLQTGEHVLIIGASGGVGTFAVQIAKSLGAQVTGVCSTGKLDLVRSIGADHAIDYTQHSITDGDERYDLILDIAGNRPLSQLRRALATTGTLVIVGGEGRGRWLGSAPVRQFQATALSPFVDQRLGVFMTSQNSKDLDTLRDLIETGAVTPVIDRVCSLPEVPDAIRDLDAGRARGKIVVAV